MSLYRKTNSLENINLNTRPSTISSVESRNNDFSCHEQPDKTTTLPAKYKPCMGFFYVFMSSVFVLLTTVLFKKLSYIDPGDLCFIRNVGVFAGCLPIAVYSVKEIFGPKKDRFVLLLRGFIGATSLYLHLLAFRYMPLAEAAVVMSIVPALTTVIARIYLKELCGRMQILSLFISLCGVLLSVRLPELLTNRRHSRFDAVYLGGLAAAVGCVIFLSATFVVLRKMKDIHFSVTSLYLGFLGMVENVVIAFLTSSFEYPRCGGDQIFVMLIGIFGFMSQCMFTLAIQTEEIGIVTVKKASLDILVAMILQTIFFDADFDKYNIIGAILVITSVSILGFEKWLRMLPEESTTRKKLTYIL